MSVIDQSLLELQRAGGTFRRWTDEDDAALLRMHKARIRGNLIAETLRRTENGVRCRLRDLKKRRRAGNA